MIVRKIRNNYTYFNKLALGFYFIKTKIVYPKARLIRSGFHIRGKKYVQIGKNFTTGYNCRIEAFMDTDQHNESNYRKIIIGENVQLNDNVHISAIRSVEIGNDVLIASLVYISDNSHGYYKGGEHDTSPLIPPSQRHYDVKKVKIGHRVWIGEGVIVMPGVTIGNGAIIGAHSIVKSDVPENCIAVGTPARVVKKWDNINNRWVKVN